MPVGHIEKQKVKVYLSDEPKSKVDQHLRDIAWGKGAILGYCTRAHHSYIFVVGYERKEPCHKS